ncbi:MAG: carboxylating nicotinate-nucleotide diphosphorylase [Thermoplasmata archaeon]|nr:carboxylating nicotinate-nucleotide diphosphorylase [Thermoplasmata archaeon]
MDPIGYYLEEDLGKGDATTLSLGIGERPAKASIVTNEPCILAGGEETVEVFSRLDARAIQLVEDGDRAEAGAVVMEIDGKAGAILAGERLALNILSRMSGIATATRILTEKVQAIDPRVKIAATRKTTPGFRVYEKKAVELGGGEQHRQRLDDLVLIKDNHLAMVGSVGEAVRRAKEASELKVEVEVENMEQALEAVEAEADIILLDNMTPGEAKECFGAIKDHSPDTLVEVSGGITPENAHLYASCADRISMSRITSYSPPIDLTLHFL